MRTWLVVLVTALALAACAPASDDADGGGETAQEAATVRLYTTVTEDTVNAVVDAWGDQSDVEIEVFRAPTAEFNARVAAEQREGQIRADVFWLTEPTSMLQFEEQGLLHAFEPAEAEALPDALRSETFWGTRVLNLVIAHRTGHTPAPADWPDLADPALSGEVGVFDPGFAGSGLAALGYFAFDEDYGTEFFSALADNGATQVQSPGEVLTGVAEERFATGILLDKLLRDAIDDGSPVELVWPESGAIRITSPIAVLAGTGTQEAAEGFVDFVLSAEAQQAIAGTGWQPVRDDVEWPHRTEPTVEPDYEATFEQQDELLEEWRSAFGG